MGLTEDEIRPADLMMEQARHHQNDARWLLARRDRFVDVTCPACDDRQHEPTLPTFKKDGFLFVTCFNCGTAYVTPRPNQELLAEFYATSENYVYWNERIFPASEAVRREKIFRPRVERVCRICDAGGIGRGILLEVGAGFGIFCEEIHRLGRFDRVIAVDPMPSLAATCRVRKLEVIEEPIEQVVLDGQVDVIVGFEVIEHLFSPANFLNHCQRLLGFGGLLVLSCPNVRGFDVAMLREKSSTVDFEHLNLFHPASLSVLLARCGFQVIEVSTPGQLDAELVRKATFAGDVILSPFLQHVLVDEWEVLGEPFQNFLVEHGLSSHMWVVARKEFHV